MALSVVVVNATIAESFVGSVKSELDQRFVAGVGNIYANEALFRAGIRPTRRANTLTKREAARLRETLRAVLAKRPCRVIVTASPEEARAGIIAPVPA